MIDFHIHTSLSHDSEEEMENYIKKAIDNGDKIIGFAEHYDYDAFLDGELSLTNLDEYYAKICDMRAKFGQIEVLFGIELGYNKLTVDKFNEVLNKYPFDFVINSVHNVEGEGDFVERYFKGRTKEQAYLHYFNTVLKSLNDGFDFDVVGHLGYVSRYWKGEDKSVVFDEYKDVLTKILTEIIRQDKCLEINTSSYGCGDDFLPNYQIIQAYVNLGGINLSFGSDSHKVADYNRKIDLLVSKLKALGINKLCYYKARKRLYYDI